MVNAWVVSFISNVAVVFPTSSVIDGVCYAYTTRKSKAANVFLWNFLSFCYWRILVVIRRLARVAASHAADGPSNAQNQLTEIQSCVTKTMLFVSVCYAVSWLPAY